MTDTAMNQAKTDSIPLASLIQLLSEVNPNAFLYSDDSSVAGQYHPKLNALPFEPGEFCIHSEISGPSVTVGEFLSFLRGAVQSLVNNGHTATMESHVWMSFRPWGIAVLNEGLVTGLKANVDGSYTLQRTKTEFIAQGGKRWLVEYC